MKATFHSFHVLIAVGLPGPDPWPAGTPAPSLMGPLLCAAAPSVDGQRQLLSFSDGGLILSSFFRPLFGSGLASWPFLPGLTGLSSSQKSESVQTV